MTPEAQRPFRLTVCLDFDGVLHAYSRGWCGGEIYDPPMPGAREALLALIEAGYELVVSTVRDDLDAVWAWLHEHDLGVLVRDVTNAKPIAVLYIDDRALRFEAASGWTAAVPQALALLAVEHG